MRNQKETERITRECVSSLFLHVIIFSKIILRFKKLNFDKCFFFFFFLLNIFHWIGSAKPNQANEYQINHYQQTKNKIYMYISMEIFKSQYSKRISKRVLMNSRGKYIYFIIFSLIFLWNSIGINFHIIKLQAWMK